MVLFCFYFAAAIDSGGLFVMHDGAQKCLCQETTGSYLGHENQFRISE